MNKQILDRGTSVDPNSIPATLKKTELSRQAKREHLASRGVKGQDAEDVLQKIYGDGE